MNLYLTTLTLIFASPAFSTNDEFSAPDVAGEGPCPCCCREVVPPQQPTQQQLDEINHIYQTVPWDKRTLSVRQLEEQILLFDGYQRCEVCHNIVGPGIPHRFRHPLKMTPRADILILMQAIEAANGKPEVSSK